MSPSFRRTHWPSFRSMAGKRIILRLPAQEIGDEGKTERLALLRMELGAGLVVAGDEGGHRPAVVDGRHHVLRVRRGEMVGMDEIGVKPRRDAVEERMRTLQVKRVPADLR